MSTQETESDVSSINNENISVTVTKKPHCQVKFDIKVEPHATEAAYQKAIKNINKEVTIPGFRKGKAPEKLILERYDPTIQKEFVDLTLSTAFNEALQLTHLHPLKDGHLKRPVVHECSRENGAHFTIEFECRPAIPSIKLEDLQFKKVAPISITEQDSKNAIENLRLQFATYEPIQDRPVQEDDFTEVSVTILEEPPREVIHNQRTQVNETGLPSWLRQKVIGLNPGESAEGMTEQDSNLSESAADFRSLPFRVTVNSIWKGTLPELDEELAKKVGLQSLEELNKKISERLEQEAQEDALQLEIQALENLLIQKYPIDLPQSYIDSNKEARLSHYLDQLDESQLEKQNYQQIEESIEKSTIYHLQLFFLFRKIASDHGVTIDNEDISQELTRQIALMSSGRSSINFNGDKDELREQLYNLALDRKIKKFLIDHVGLKG